MQMFSISRLQLGRAGCFQKLTWLQRGPYKETGDLTSALPDYTNEASGFLTLDTENLSPHNIIQS